MQPQTLGELFGDPGFLALFFSILLVIGNIMVGVGMLPGDRRRKFYKAHRLVYFLVMVTFSVYLWLAWREDKANLVHYFVYGYFLTAIPFTRRIHETLHAVLASVGLVLLVVLVAFGI
ncbi:MAG: hypothetical protein KC553_12890 [Nitrospina sp.]|nr:hypothetical protein [Nitrospina sp.]